MISFPGWVTRTTAIKQGFTHDGWYWFLPIYVADVDGDFCVMTKWRPLGRLLEPMTYIEGFLRGILFPDDPPVMQFKIWRM
jgi:hypothetical protein